MRALLAVPASRARMSTIDELPAPVARYRALAVGDRAPIRTVLMQHGGTFRTHPGAHPAPIHGTQLFTADPPGFVWSARVRMAPLLWFDARDEIVDGKGSMRVLFDSTIPVVNAAGAYLDQGAALRLLAELAWLPTSLFDARYVRWSAIDEAHARATLRLRGREVSAVYAFDASGLPSHVDGERYMDGGELRPWGGTFRDYRRVSTMLVPFEAEVTWQLETGPFTYAHWIVESVEYDVADLAALTDGDQARSSVDPAPNP
jgi:hypothetical protein